MSAKKVLLVDGDRRLVTDSSGEKWIETLDGKYGSGGLHYSEVARIEAEPWLMDYVDVEWIPVAGLDPEADEVSR